jgi:hypothetical protein
MNLLTRKLLLLIPLMLFISACNTTTNNEPLKANSNAASNKSTPSASVSTVPYSAPPVSRLSKGTPTAIEVSHVLKKANIFPKENGVRENPLSDLDRKEGALTSVVVESFRPEGTTIKVYETIEQRNQARLRMIKECPGCNFIIECGPILVYQPTTMDRETIIHEHALHKERYGVLRHYFHCD